MEMDYSDWGARRAVWKATEKKQKKNKKTKTKSACAECVLIISVNHSLCVFMGSLVITVHVYARIGVI